MVATAEIILESKLHGKRRSTSISSAPSVVNKSAESEKSVDAFVPLSLRGESNTLGGVANQSWTLDSQGNWSSVTTNGTTQTRTANAQNQITSISGSATPTYDANGNMTTDQSGNTYVYNAWNQLVAVKNSAGAVIAQYTYDARGYRISETYPQGGTGIPAGETNYIYYDSSWQAIETRTNGTASSNVTSQTVWSAAYVNAAVLQDTYTAGVIQPNSRLYFEQDANWDTTAVVGLVGGNWQVVQRFTYSPYGTITVLNADWSTPPAGAQPIVNNLYQGMTLDSVTGLYYERYRNYSPSLGTWISQDPLQYINGANTYQFVMSNPVVLVDPSGLSMIPLGQGSPFLSTPNYKPPGWNPSWPTGIDNRGPYTQNPDSGVKYYPDEKNLDSHWPHYDTDQGPKVRYPRNCEKPWPSQKKPPYDYQSDKNPWDDIPDGDKLIVVDGDGAAAGGSAWEIAGDDLGEWLGGGPIVWVGSVIFGDTGTAR